MCLTFQVRSLPPARPSPIPSKTNRVFGNLLDVTQQNLIRSELTHGNATRFSPPDAENAERYESVNNASVMRTEENGEGTLVRGV